jgi:uncharacterized membrane protein YheB (UPF0754 family)
VLAIEWVNAVVHNKWFEPFLIVTVATFHGYGAAWLAVRMLFRPHRAVKVFGLTVWPQGMIPRHRARLAETIGHAVGNELVSQETVVHALFETGFFRRKVESFVGSYTEELLEKNYATFLDAIPKSARVPLLDALAALQLRIAEHIAGALKSEETAEALSRFVDKRVDELLSQRLSEAVSPEAFEQVLGFVENRFRGIVGERGFESKVREFVSSRVDELADSRATLAEMFTPDTVAVIKERIDSQVPPIVQHLTDLATSRDTRKQIGALIKREVDDYYKQLSFFKKIFVSRDQIHGEVDDLVNKTLPRRVGEFLSGEAFERQAEEFINASIDSLLARPVNELIGNVAPDKLELIKDQIAERVLSVAQSPELSTSVSAYLTDALERLKPHSLRALLEHARPDSPGDLKRLLARALVGVLAREETARTINAILAAQVEKLLVRPIGRVGDLVPEEKVRRAAEMLTERIDAAARERLPAAIAEFDIGRIVEEKVAGYPVKKLEDLVLSVAKQHLRTIELFGLFMGFFIGVVQAGLMYFGVIGR